MQLAAEESGPAAPDYLLSVEDLEDATYQANMQEEFLEVWAIYTENTRNMLTNPGRRQWSEATLLEIRRGEAMVEFDLDYREICLPLHMIALRIGEYSDVPPELPPLEAPESNASVTPLPCHCSLQLLPLAAVHHLAHCQRQCCSPHCYRLT